MFAVYPVYTDFSDDSVYPMEQVVRDAIDGGMDEICFTYPVYIARIKELHEIYREKNRIRIGAEEQIKIYDIKEGKAAGAIGR